MIAMDRRLFTHLNWALIAFTALLFFVGVANLYSASGTRLEEGMEVSSFYQKQLIWGGMGFLSMLVCMTFDYRHLKSLALPFFLITVALLLGVQLFGVVVYGARRWISLGLFNIQPSEVAKITVLVMGALMLSKGKNSLNWKELSIIVGVGLIPAGLIVIQPDLGTTLNLLLLLGGMILYHGIQWRVLKVCLCAVPLVAPLGWFCLHDYQKQRIMTFLDPSLDPHGSGYHILQSQIAIGSGEMWGKGFLHGTQSQLRFLPEKHTDFAIAVFGEEWGFWGCIALLVLICLFLLSICSTARDAKDRFGSTLAAGVFFYFFWQFLINMGMVMGLLPVVGIPMPFISYGGTATLVNFCLIGLVLNVSMRRFVFKSS
ncbi:MAG: rod shape-determining protein RodA [Pseudomonadota bacterium]